MIANSYTVTRQDHNDASDQHDVPVIDAPIIGGTAARALRHRVTDLRHDGGDPVRWFAGDSLAWGAVMDLHRRAKHDEATELARFLYWTERLATASTRVVWTLVPTKQES